jgi:hypothetical protein
MRFFDWLRGKSNVDDEKLIALASSIAEALNIQIVAVGGHVPDLATARGAKALGYVYGFVDAGLRALGLDMADTSIGVPVVYQVLRRVFPDSEQRYLEFVVESVGNDRMMMAGILLDGQQYVDWVSGRLKAPMGLARCLIELADIEYVWIRSCCCVCYPLRSMSTRRNTDRV